MHYYWCTAISLSTSSALFILIIVCFTRDSTYSAKRVLAVMILSVRRSVWLSQPGIGFKPRWDRDSGFSPRYSVDSFLWANFVPLGEENPLERRHQRGVARAAVGMAFQSPYPSHTHRNPHWNPHGNPHTHETRTKYSITCRPTIPHRQILAVC